MDYETETPLTDKLTDFLETRGCDDYTIEGDNSQVQADAYELLNSARELLWGTGRAVKVVRLTEHSRTYGDSTRYTLSLVVAIPRPEKTTTRIRRRHKLAGNNDQGADDGTSVGTEPKNKSRRNPRLT